MKKIDDVFSMTKERDLEEVRVHIKALSRRLNREWIRLCDYMENNYGQWISLIDGMNKSFESKGFESSLPSFISDFAHERYTFLNNKKAYIDECLALVKGYEKEKGSADIDKLGEMDAIMTSIANSLGFFQSALFAERWFGKEGN